MLNFDSLLQSQVTAYYGWMVEQDLIPEIVFDTAHSDVVIPEHLKASPILVLNISMNAASRLQFTETSLNFDARFNGRSFALRIPYRALLAMTSRSLEPKFQLPILPGDALEHAYQAANGTAPQIKTEARPTLTAVGEHAPAATPEAPAPQRPVETAVRETTSSVSDKPSAVILQGRFGQTKKSD